MEKQQFQVLFRQFLFRMVDLDLLSTDALGGLDKLFGQFASLLLFVSVLLALPALGYGRRGTPPLALLYSAWSFEHFLIATTMLVVGLFSVLSWDSIFPNRRDVLVLAPLPVRARTLFCAKVAAVMAALGLTVAMLHAAAGALWPLFLAAGAPPAQTAPALFTDPALPPLDAAGLETMLDHDLAGTPTARIAIGVLVRGERQVLTYGPGNQAFAAADGMLTQLQANLRLSPRAIRYWHYNADAGSFWRESTVAGYRSYAFFVPRGGDASVVLAEPDGPLPAQLLGERIRARMAGEPALSLATVRVPASGGFVGLLRVFAVYWSTMLAAGGFVFGSVLGIQGLAAQLLPRGLFLRVSSILQIAALSLFVSGYFLQPVMAGPEALAAAQGRGWLACSPSYWFLGFFQQWNGSPALAPLARRAWLGLAAAFTAATIAYVLSYVRTMRRIVEEPDIVPRGRRAAWLPRCGGALETAIVQFSVRALLRSRQHRVILAFYLGIGFAITILILRSPATQQSLSVIADPWREVNVPMLASSIVMLCFWILGSRVVLSLPLDLPANWVFRVIPVRGGPHCLSGRRRALLLLGVAPVWAGVAVLFLSLWPWRAASAYLVILGLLGAILAELCLRGARKIPFTCSYLPGKSNVHMRFWFVLFLLAQLLDRATAAAREALANPATYAATIAILAVVILCVRTREPEGVPLDFEESTEPAVQQLGLR